MSNFKTNSSQKSNDQLQVEIIKLGDLIRYHRDQRGDDRCWLDDELLYEALPETINNAQVLPSKEIFMEKCARFHSRRQAPKQTQHINQVLNQQIDQNVKGMTEAEQKKEIARLRHRLSVCIEISETINEAGKTIKGFTKH